MIPTPDAQRRRAGIADWRFDPAGNWNHFCFRHDRFNSYIPTRYSMLSENTYRDKTEERNVWTMITGIEENFCFPAPRG